MGALRSARRKVVRSMGGTRAVRTMEDAKRVRRGEQPHFFPAAPPPPLDSTLARLLDSIVSLYRRARRALRLRSFLRRRGLVR